MLAGSISFHWSNAETTAYTVLLADVPHTTMGHAYAIVAWVPELRTRATLPQSLDSHLAVYMGRADPQTITSLPHLPSPESGSKQ